MPVGMRRTPITSPPEPVYARDAELIKACLAGDDESWKTLIRRYQDLMYSIPRRYGLDRHDAGDVYQTVCLALWKGLPELRSEKALTRWIETTTRRQSERLAFRRRRHAAESEEVLMNVADLSPSVLEAVKRTEEEHRVRRAVERLPEKCRGIVIHLYLSAPPLSYDEVAERLGMPRGSVAPTRARCLEKLKRLLKG